VYPTPLLILVFATVNICFDFSERVSALLSQSRIYVPRKNINKSLSGEVAKSLLMMS
jgi:hypothetical protein